MNTTQFLENLHYRFTSGNDVPVERTQLNATELGFLQRFSDKPLIQQIFSQNGLVLFNQVNALRTIIDLNRYELDKKT